MSLSVVISTYNREEKLKHCLESVKDIADEIIVVDNSSSDNSVSLAKKYTSHVFIRKNNPMLNVNKNFGFSKASKDWILYLDDDEEVTAELAKEIKKVISESNPSPQPSYHKGTTFAEGSPKKGEEDHGEVAGYWIPRKNIIFGKWIEHTGWYPDHQMRLFKRGKGEYREVHVHEMIQINGEGGYLKEGMIHYNYAGIQEFLQKTIVLYAPNEAQVLLDKGYTFSAADALLMPFKEFLSRFFAREGYKDGLHGLVLSLLMASYHLIVFSYLWEKKGFPQHPVSLSGVQKQLQTFGNEWRFWMTTEKEKQSASPIEKILLRVKRKLGL